MTSISIARRRLLTGTAALLAAPAFVRPARAATTLKISTSFPNDPKFSAARIWYDIFVVRLKTATDGQIATTFYPDNQLGQEADVVNQVKLGVVDRRSRRARGPRGLCIFQEHRFRVLGQPAV
jgi:TRAP-type transport system periplasmic protein